MPKAEKIKGTNARFLAEHVSKYGLKIMERCPNTGDVVSVRCQFCIYFGPETDPEKPRQRAKKQQKWHGRTAFELICIRNITIQNILQNGRGIKLVLTKRKLNTSAAKSLSKTLRLLMSTPMVRHFKLISMHLSSIPSSVICFSILMTKAGLHRKWL